MANKDCAKKSIGKSDFTKAIQSLRAREDLTQKDVASKLGITVVAYRNKEKGKTQFKLREVKIMAKLFNTPFETFENV